MRKFFIVILVILVILVLFCIRDPRVLPVNQTKNDIERIELLCTSEYGVLDEDMTVVAILTGSDAELFWDDLQEIEVGKNLFSPPSYYGKLVVSIHYKDGGNDILGTEICAYHHNGRVYHNDYYYLNYEDIRELFSQYGDEKLLPE